MYNVKNSFTVCMVLKIVTIPVSLVSLDICEETQKGQSMMWILGGCVEVRSDLVSREVVSRVLVCRKCK